MATPSLPLVPPITEWRRWVPDRPVLVAWAVLAAVLTWTYGATFYQTIRVWWETPDYGHCFFVPVFAGFLLWTRQKMVDPWPRQWSWWALPFFAVWVLMRWGCVYFGYQRDLDTLFPFLVGVTLFVGGWKAFRWAWPSLAFLVFMDPLPGALAGGLSQPLQQVATKCSVYTLQTLGIPAIVPGGVGNVIQLSDPESKLEVAQACSGLRMLMLFFAICVGAAFLLRASWWEKVVIVVSAPVIAVISNVARISIAGIVTEVVNRPTGEFVHDHAGWIMMPLAMLMIWGIVRLVNKLWQEEPAQRSLALGVSHRTPVPAMAGVDRPRGHAADRPLPDRKPRPAPE
jgi:exosortase